MEALNVQQVKKSFRSDMMFSSREILHDVSFFGREGEILGFLGPNGAGKTTTIKIILGLLRPDDGSVRIFGRPAGEKSSRARIGYLPENPYFYPHLSLKEFLEFCGMLSGISKKKLSARCEEMISLVGLDGHERQKIKSFSKGMLQRTGLAQAILHDPDLLILDEPFSGLDPVGRKAVRDIILKLRKKGKTIFFSSHILPDMEALCDRTVIIKNGVITKSIGLDEVFRIGENRIEITARGCSSETVDDLRDYLEKVDSTDEETFLFVKKQEYIRTVIQHIYNAGGEILKVANEHPTLEEMFMNLVNDDTSAAEKVAVKSSSEKEMEKEEVL